MHPVRLILLLFASIEACTARLAFRIYPEDGEHNGIYKRDVNDSSHSSLQISGLTATALGGNRANVKWENATGPITGYEITVCMMREYPQCYTENGQKTSYDLRNLDSGTTYEVEVRAYLQEVTSRTNGKAERTSFTTASVPAVSQLQAMPLGPTSLEVTWIYSRASPVHFEIDVCPESGGVCFHMGTRNNTHVLEKLTPDTAYNIIVRSVTEEGKELTFGPRSNVSARTEALPPIADVSLKDTCDGFVVSSWSYPFQDITGFELAFCTEGQRCITTVIDKDSRSHAFLVKSELRVYTLSLTAYLWRAKAKYTTPVANASTTSLPQVPALDDLEARAVSLTDVKVTWKTLGDFDIRFRVCSQDSPNRNCANYVAHGSQLSYTISGLTPNTKYRIGATGVVTAGTDSCQGAEVVRELVTPAEVICRYTDQLGQTLKEVSENVKALLRRQSAIADQGAGSDRIHAQCQALEAKLRTLSEKDLADCLRDIYDVINTYQSKAAQSMPTSDDGL